MSDSSTNDPNTSEVLVIFAFCVAGFLLGYGIGIATTTPFSSQFITILISFTIAFLIIGSALVELERIITRKN
ncbi:MAG: hypothetical protein GF317_00525 [Candidatus Lokiarchaeota archaeon]|nr:hypothetical protein [Candidatus Lokiarchaeota archaeon]MBD3198461.1 hypothetical protein [Candidatus Lokiarchaeota archaeon]